MSFIWSSLRDNETSDFVGDLIDCFCEGGDGFDCRYGVYLDNEYDAYPF